LSSFSHCCQSGAVRKAYRDGAAQAVALGGEVIELAFAAQLIRDGAGEVVIVNRLRGV